MIARRKINITSLIRILVLPSFAVCLADCFFQWIKLTFLTTRLAYGALVPRALKRFTNQVQSTVLLFYWLIAWWIAWLIAWLITFSNELSLRLCQPGWRPAYRAVAEMFHQPGRINSVTVLLTDRLVDCLTDCLNDCLTDCVADCFVDCLAAHSYQ